MKPQDRETHGGSRHFPPDKGGMRGVWGGQSCKKANSPATETPPVLPLSGEGRNDKRRRAYVALNRHGSGCATWQSMRRFSLPKRQGKLQGHLDGGWIGFFPGEMK